jgi:hypothetical protein
MDQWRPYPADSEKVWEDPVSFRQGAQPWFVIRGGCWASLEEGDLVSTSRDKSPSVAGGYRGFRIVLGKKVVVPPQAPAKRKRR